MKTKIFIMMLLLLGVFVSGHVWAACIQDPIGLWALDENASPYINTMNPGTYDGTCTSCPAVDNSAYVGSSQIFDGVGNGISIADDGTAIFDRMTTDSFSIAAWFRRPANAGWAENEVVVGRYSWRQTHFWVGLENQTGHAYFRLWDNDSFNQTAVGFTVGNVNLADDQWHHIVAVRNGQTNQNFLYVDGVEAGVTSVTYTGTFTADAPMTIGQMNNEYYFNGNIDEVAFFDDALTVDIVTEMFNAGNNQTSICTDDLPLQITSQPETTATVGVEYTYNPTTNNPDGELTWELLDSHPTGMVIDTTTGAITWTPTADQPTSNPIRLRVSDTLGGEDIQEFTIETGGDGPGDSPSNDDDGGDSSSGGGCFIDMILQ